VKEDPPHRKVNILLMLCLKYIESKLKNKLLTIDYRIEKGFSIILDADKLIEQKYISQVV